jgi:sulfide:quinone oxidoreductase
VASRRSKATHAGNGSDVEARSRVVVLGGGVVGLTAAHELRRRLHGTADILVLSDRGQFVLPMGLLSVPFDRRSDEIGFSVGPSLASKGIGFRVGRVDRVDPDRRLVISQGDEVPYDFLLIATGPDADVQGVPGLGGEFGTAYFLHSETGALDLSEAVDRFLRDPGPAVVGLVPGASYLSPAYEFVLQLDYALRERGHRDAAQLTFVTSEPSLGYLDAGTKRAQELLEAIFRERRIEIYDNAELARVGSDFVELHNGVRLPSQLTVVVPAFRGTAWIWKTSGLTDERGYVPVDECYRHRTYGEVFAAGTAAEPESARSAQATVPKTGYVATAMAKAAARNIASAIAGHAPQARALPRVFDLRIIDGGDTGLMLAGIGRTQPLRVAMKLRGGLAHAVKGWLNQYVLWKLRTGRTYLP